MKCVRSVNEPIGRGRDNVGAPEEVAIAVEWLRLNPPNEPVSLQVVLGKHYRACDADDQGLQVAIIVQYWTNVYNTENDVHNDRPSGNRIEAMLRRHRKSRPDIHARVLNGELSAHPG